MQYVALLSIPCILYEMIGGVVKEQPNDVATTRSTEIIFTRSYLRTSKILLI